MAMNMRHPILTAAAFAAISLTPWTVSAQAPGPNAQGNAQAVEQADARLRQARERCEQGPSSDRSACLEQARQAHAQAISGAAGGPLPAVQTQSSDVKETGGSAPVAVDERTPGKPAPSRLFP